MTDDINWVFTVKKRLSWISEMLQVEGMSPAQFRESLGVDCGFCNAKMVLFHEYMDASEIMAFDKMIIDGLARNDGKMAQIIPRCYDICREFAGLGEDLAIRNWRTASDDELIAALRLLHKCALKMIPVVYFLPNVNDRLRELLLMHLQGVGQEEDVEEYFLVLTSTTEELLIIKEQRDLLSIGALIQDNPELRELLETETTDVILANLPAPLVNRLSKHAVNYGWINTDDMFGDAWTEADLVARLKHLVNTDCKRKIEEALERQAHREQQCIDLVSTFQLEGELLRLVEFLRAHSHLRTHRTEVYVRTMFQASDLLREIADRLQLAYRDILYMSLEELRASLLTNSPICQEELAQRKAGLAYIMINGHLTTYFGHDATWLAEEEGLLSEPEDSPCQIEGTIANLGFTRGVVKVVHDISELHKVQTGDVLVASMTIPEFVPAMELAAAFVTDEGGITCHAAIVSREMGVPCIIGTEMATKVLKDGDVVEVDAYNGIIKVVNEL